MTRKSEKGRPNCRNDSVRAPQPFSDIVDQICYKDKMYFEEHPDITSFLRSYVPGEFWPLIFSYDTWVRVRQVQPGLRMRSAVLDVAKEVKEG